MQIRYNGLSVVNSFSTTTGQLGDLETLLDWHRNDPPDDFEMHRNNVVYTWQFNRNPLIDYPDLVEYIWGNQVGSSWNSTLSLANVKDNQVIGVYPNPVKDKLYILGINKPFSISIFSSEGRQVISESNKANKTLDLNLANGLYLVRIKTENKFITRKIIIK